MQRESTNPFRCQRPISQLADIGTLGGTCSTATSLNNRGQVAGQSSLAGDITTHPFFYDGTKLIDIGTLGGSFGLTTWVNDPGEVSGGATTAGNHAFHAFFWKNGVMPRHGKLTIDDFGAENMNIKRMLEAKAGNLATFALGKSYLPAGAHAVGVK